MDKMTVSTDDAPAAIGPYSQAVNAGDRVYVSGQIPMTPGGELVSGDVREQAEQVLKNLQAILSAAGSDIDKVLKTTIYADDLDDYDTINEVYAGYFSDNPPARAFVEVSRLPRGVKLEIEAVAVL